MFEVSLGTNLSSKVLQLIYLKHSSFSKFPDEISHTSELTSISSRVSLSHRRHTIFQTRRHCSRIIQNVKRYSSNLLSYIVYSNHHQLVRCWKGCEWPFCRTRSLRNFRQAYIFFFQLRRSSLRYHGDIWVFLKCSQWIHWNQLNFFCKKQECIPVGCVPPTLQLPSRGGGCLAIGVCVPWGMPREGVCPGVCACA